MIGPFYLGIEACSDVTHFSNVEARIEIFIEKIVKVEGAFYYTGGHLLRVALKSRDNGPWEPQYWAEFVLIDN